MNEMTVRRVAVLGAGTTGRALAAHLTNLGFSVTLMDASAASASEGLEHIRATLYVPERAAEIRLSSFDEGIPSLRDADWIVEAIVESLPDKRALFERIAPFVRPDAVVSTCTATLPVSELGAGLPDSVADRIVGAYFALPIAEHRLVEIRPGPDAALAREFGRFLAENVARRVVEAPDGPGGIAGRYGLWCLLLGAHVAEKLRLGVEDVEMATGPFLGQSDGIFGAIDRVGLDELRNAAGNMQARLPNDRGARYFALPSTAVGMLARGWTGDKAGRGFFRHEGRERLALNLTTMAYLQTNGTTLPGLASSASSTTAERLKSTMSARDELGEFVREFLLTALRYAEYLRDAMGVTVVDFDRTMEWGFGWEKGPFRLLDDLGIGAAKYYEGDRYWTPVGYSPILVDVVCPRMGDCPVLDRAEGYTIHDLDDGIQAIAFHEGILTPSRVAALLAIFENPHLQRFVLTSEGKDFPDLDLPFVVNALKTDVPALDAYLASLQTLGELLQTRSSVAAIQGRCVGPCLGLALSCARIVALADAEIGFYEGRLGILPTARATALMRAHHGGSSKKMAEVTVALAEGIIAANADLARSIGFLRSEDETEYLPERLMATAKEAAMTVEPRPLESFAAVEGPLVGLIDRGLAERRQRGGLTDHDVVVGQRIRQIVARTEGYSDVLDRERRESIDLGVKALTQARIRHLIETNKYLRN